MAPKVTAVIPARLGSKRFPNKVIYPLKGRPLLFYVYNELTKSKIIDRVIIATDSDKISQEAQKFGAEVVKTSKSAKCGTDRIAEAAKKVGGNIFINVQGDNFGMKAAVLDRALEKYIDSPKDKFGTMAYRIKNDSDLFDPNRVKLICDNKDYALWFSRFPIPYLMNVKTKSRFNRFNFLGHIGVYFFRRQALLNFRKWPQGNFEKAESLEQLRILENGERIKVYKTSSTPISIDSVDDLKKIKNKI